LGSVIVTIDLLENINWYENCACIWSDPDIMKKFQVDRGAIKFVLSGANIMCPGLTSPGGALDDEVEEETPVVNGLC